MNTVATPCMIAVPSMLMVAPSGTVNEATAFFTPMRCSTVSSVTGMVALLLAVEKAKTSAARILRKNISGLVRPRKTSKKVKTPHACSSSATTTQRK